MAIRLLVVNHTTLYAGAEQNLRDLLSRFPRDEVQLLAVVAPGRGPARTVMESSGMRCLDLPVPQFSGKRSPLPLAREFAKCTNFRRTLRDLLIKEKPDLVYASSPHAAIAVEPVLARAGLPWVWQIPDIINNKWINRLVLRGALKSCNAVMAVSRATAESIIRMGADASKVHLAYCGVEVRLFDLAFEVIPHFREEHGLGTDVPLIGMFGQVTQWKGWHVLVEAMPKVANVFPKSRFVFVGRPMMELDHVYQSDLKTRLADLGLDEAVTWTGFREDVARIMTACDVIVHASIKPEPLGMVIMEGMAAGRPVICTRGGGTEEMIQHNSTGIVVPPGNPSVLAEAINKLLSDPDLRKRMGNRARRVAETRFTHEHRVWTYLKVFRQVLATG